MPETKPKPTVHKLKVWPEFYEPISLGLKTFEIRVNDRNFQMGDILVLRWFNPKTNSFSRTMKELNPSLPLYADEILEFPDLHRMVGFIKNIGDEMVVLSLLPLKERK
ncbi:DUF3850 domain-containing protein [Bdellovibrio bacteriovorus]|uniref:DUF3850 domain-containing protein n=1 Tax=Bdellovibrio bacteriovorus TaxID=959 RepID=UPI0035A6C144